MEVEMRTLRDGSPFAVEKNEGCEAVWVGKLEDSIREKLGMSAMQHAPGMRENTTGGWTMRTGSSIWKEGATMAALCCSYRKGDKCTHSWMISSGKRSNGGGGMGVLSMLERRASSVVASMTLKRSTAGRRRACQRERVNGEGRREAAARDKDDDDDDDDDEMNVAEESGIVKRKREGETGVRR
jgi:hypothetical protein